MEIKHHLQALNLQKMPEGMNSLTKLNKSQVLTHDEEILLEKHRASRMFQHLSGAQQVMAIKTLLLKISVITGWPMPTGEIKSILEDQLYKKITEKYSDFNVEEIEYAFRDKGTIVEDWGKEINLNLIDKILIPYREERYEASGKLERLLPPPEPRRWTAEDILNSYRSEIEVYFQAIKKGYQPILHIYFEETLRGDGMMKEDETIGEFFVRKLNSGTEHLYVKE